MKAVTVVEINSGKQINIREIPLTPKHDLREIRGTYEELMLKKNYEHTATDDYIHAVLTDENDVIDALAKMRVVYPNIMKLTYDNVRTRRNQSVSDLTSVEDRKPIDLFAEFYEKQNNQAMSEEQKALVTDCIESIWEG